MKHELPDELVFTVAVKLNRDFIATHPQVRLKQEPVPWTAEMMRDDITHRLLDGVHWDYAFAGATCRPSQEADWQERYWRRVLLDVISGRWYEQPIPMLLFCPNCGAQHVDQPDASIGWNNPPHRSHLCHACRTVWRPADVPTVGVWSIATIGQHDTYKPLQTAQSIADGWKLRGY